MTELLQDETFLKLEKEISDSNSESAKAAIMAVEISIIECDIRKAEIDFKDLIETVHEAGFETSIR